MLKPGEPQCYLPRLIHTEEKELEVEKHFGPGEEDPVFRQPSQEGKGK